MPLVKYKEHFPVVAEGVFIAPTAWVTGDVEIAEEASVFFGASIRGDINPIRIGRRSNIQEQVVIHTSRGLTPCIVEENVTIGHGAILHGCSVKSSCIIGMGATILDQAVVGENCIVGANSLISMRTIIPPNSMVYGSPAKVVRSLTQAELDEIQASASHYIKVAAIYLNELSRD